MGNMLTTNVIHGIALNIPYESVDDIRVWEHYNLFYFLIFNCLSLLYRIKQDRVRRTDISSTSGSET